MFRLLFKRRRWHPKYWLLATLLFFAWCATRLPYGWLLAFAPGFGRFIYAVSKKVRYVTYCNVRACFPHLNEQELEAFVKETAEELGFSFLETFIVWFRDTHTFFESRCAVEGEQHLYDAIQSDKGIILLACHFGSVDVNGALLSQLDVQGRSLIGTFRQTDDVINDFLGQVRGKYCDQMISAADQRAMVRALRNKSIIWYAPDIEVKNKNSVFVDFMNVKASTTLATARLARAGRALVLPYTHYRESNAPHYRIKIFPPLEDFPTEDFECDTQRVNAAIETMIAPYPQRYWWAIKRFKRRPSGEPGIY